MRGAFCCPSLAGQSNGRGAHPTRATSPHPSTTRTTCRTSAMPTRPSPPTPSPATGACRDDVFLLTGTDEHGINIERIADRARCLTASSTSTSSPPPSKRCGERLDIQLRPLHPHDRARAQAVALDLWRRLQASGDLYRGTYEGAYCPRCEAYYQPDELVDDACPVHGLPCDTRARGKLVLPTVALSGTRSSDWCATPTSCSR